MSDRKSRRETDKAKKHLMAYNGPNGEWERRFEQVQYLAWCPLNLLVARIDDKQG
ncbi:MAG: hypothetical protein KDI33_10845 [Halioglobus sp.]|nr:hypothetical protein [Halioglobus sp.]